VLVRSPFAKVAEREGALVAVAVDGSVLRVTGDSAELARAVLAFLAEPRAREQIIAHLEELAGEPLQHAGVLDELLRVLTSAGVLRDEAQNRPLESPPPPAARPTRLVLGLTGAIGSAHAPQLVGALLEQGYEVRIAATKSALRMVSKEVLEALTHQKVHASLRGRSPEVPAPHIHLAEWAQVVLICPATATTLSRMARGDCSDVVAAVAIATRAPVLVAPSMNPAMHTAPSVQRNLAMLEQDGVWVVHAGIGVEVAHAPADRRSIWGAAPSPEAVLKVLQSVLATSAAHQA
jgi:3-polyprenyl-4-hydroxybenzoate decarboxylase